MKIQGSRNEVLRPATSTPASGVPKITPDATKSQPSGGTGSTRSSSDSVQISDAGRALSSGDTSGTSSLTPARVAELRKRVLEGAYNSAHVAGQVAQRILDRGDA